MAMFVDCSKLSETNRNLSKKRKKKSVWSPFCRSNSSYEWNWSKGLASTSKRFAYRKMKGETY